MQDCNHSHFCAWGDGWSNVQNTFSREVLTDMAVCYNFNQSIFAVRRWVQRSYYLSLFSDGIKILSETP